jgi:hypothetical protein
MKFSPDFFKATAVCSFGTALCVILTAIFMLLISEDVPGHEDTFFMATEWLRFASVFLGFMAIWGIAARKINSYPALAGTAAIFFMVWMVLALIFRSIRIFGNYYTWQPALADNPDASTKAILDANVNFLSSMTDSIHIVILLCIIIGGTLLGLATFKGRGLERLSSIFLFLYALLGIVRLFGDLGVEWGITSVSFVYPYLRSLDRIVWGLWLWTSAKK